MGAAEVQLSAADVQQGRNSQQRPLRREAVAARIEGGAVDAERVVAEVSVVRRGGKPAECGAGVQVGDGGIAGGDVQVAERWHEGVGDLGGGGAVGVRDGFVDVGKATAEIGDAVNRAVGRQVGKVHPVQHAGDVVSGDTAGQVDIGLAESTGDVAGGDI